VDDSDARVRAKPSTNWSFRKLRYSWKAVAQEGNKDAFEESAGTIYLHDYKSTTRSSCRRVDYQAWKSWIAASEAIFGIISSDISQFLSNDERTYCNFESGASTREALKGE
jgi:hypothetical protein